MNQYNDPYSMQPGQDAYMNPRNGYYQQINYTRPWVINPKAAALGRDLRMLWAQHVFWTRLVIMAIVYGLPDADAATKRLLRNPKDFEAIFNIFYGPAIASRFATLLTEHLTIAAELVKAARAGKTAAAADAEKRWYANADQIAAALASINSYWSQETWRSMLYDQLKMAKAEADDLMTGKYDESVTQFDDIEKQAMQMADYMNGGITSQFIENFS